MMMITVFRTAVLLGFPQLIEADQTVVTHIVVFGLSTLVIISLCCGISILIKKIRSRSEVLVSLRQDLMIREEEVASLWKCKICQFSNYPTQCSCMLCGTDANNSISQLENSYVTTSSSSTVDVQPSNTKVRTDQISIANMKLNQRQLGACRRYDWIRKMDDHGDLIWSRNTQETLRHSEGFISRLVVSSTEMNERMSFSVAEGEHVIRNEFGSFNCEGLNKITMLPFQQKLAWFVSQTSSLLIPAHLGIYEIEVDRHNLLQLSCEQLLWASSTQLHQVLRVKFTGEPGIDVGGVSREWYTLVIQEAFQPQAGLFKQNHQESLCYTISPCSDDATIDHLLYFEAIGRLFGRALLEGQSIGAHLALPIYKHILGIPITFSDLQFIDAQLYQHLLWMNESNEVENLHLDFSVLLQHVNQVEIVDLKTNGRNINVTEENKKEYIDLRMRWHMVRCMSRQLASLIRGIYSVIPPRILSVFDHQELELLICGMPELDINDWMKHSCYEGDITSPIITWFWEIVREFTIEEQCRLLQFVTGSARLPVQGFQALTMNDGRLCPFSIQLITLEESSYPRARTCVNRIELPEYTSKSTLKKALCSVINLDVTGFSIE